MEIRMAGPGDDPVRISRIYAQSWKAGYRGIVPQAYLDELDGSGWVPALSDGNRRSLLLIEGGVYAGTSSFRPARDAEWRGWGEIVSLYLLPEYWGRGYGGYLLDAAVAALARDGFSDLYLWVLADNLRARGMYERHGFRPSGGVKTCAIGGKALKELRYVRHAEGGEPGGPEEPGDCPR